MTPPLQLTIYSDYLCPWCFNAMVRLHQLKAEHGDRLQLTWKPYLLVAEKRHQTIEAFQKYSKTWATIGAQTHAGTFRTWPADKTPPDWSLPAQVAAKTALHLNETVFPQFQLALMNGYFRDHRNISDEAVLFEIAKECGLPADDFEAAYRDPRRTEQVWEDHRQTINQGIYSIPSVVVNGNQVLVGAVSLQEYQDFLK